MEDTSVRDELARERTLLANERTLLAYGRTALGLVGLAVIIFKFTDDPNVAVPVGIFVLGAGLTTMVFGIKSYRALQARLLGEDQNEEQSFIGYLFSFVRIR